MKLRSEAVTVVLSGLATMWTSSGHAAPDELRTRYALFQRSSYAALPGWALDDLKDAQAALRRSCGALARRAAWQALCAELPDGEPALRRFLEARFTPLAIREPDADAEGELTGYFEPLLDGRRERGGDFVVPVHGVPRDLLTLDWTRVPPAQRLRVVALRRAGRELLPLPAPEAGSIDIDLSRHDLDTRERRLRLRVVDAGGRLQAMPYYTRAELAALGSGLDAPVLAWVRDPLALYGMQVQGSGRIRYADGHVLRLAFGDQNGQPFRPLRVAAKPLSVRTRALGDEAAATEFEVEDEAAATPSQSRGLRLDSPPAAPPRDERPRAAAVEAMVEQLLRNARPAASGSSAPPRPQPTPERSTPGAERTEGHGAAEPLPRKAFDASRLESDPSYVFFRTAPDQSPAAGPPGALGVPLTARRSVAVDPRVTPLGYPMWLAAAPGTPSEPPLQRLVLAQDTGGAIRGAVRADYFWGYGAAAGERARSTRTRSQLWVLVPNTEAERLLGGSATLTRSVGGPECLIEDDEFCSGS